MRAACLVVLVSLACGVISMTTPGYPRSSPSLKRDAGNEFNVPGRQIRAPQDWAEKYDSEEGDSSEEGFLSYYDNDSSDEGAGSDQGNSDEREGEDWNDWNNLSLDEDNRLKRDVSGRKFKGGMKRNIRDTKKPSRFCGTGRATSVVSSPKPWLLDTGIVPSGLLGGGTNDGLTGISSGPANPVLDAGSSTTGLPWYQVFSSNSIPDDNNIEQNDVNNNDDQGSDYNNDVPDQDSNSDLTDDFIDEGTNDGDPVEDDGSHNVPPSGDENQGDLGTNNEPVSCTCVSVLLCGGTLRSADVQGDEGNCPDGEVCCAIEETPLPPVPTGSTALECGKSKPYRSARNSRLLDNVADFAEFPWAVLISLKEQNPEDNGLWSYRCAGSLIHPRVVLTAAHCVNDLDTNDLTIRAGDWELASWRLYTVQIEDREVESKIIHPEYRSGHPPNDIALLLLTECFTMSENISTICLSSESDDINTSECVATGWGHNVAGQQQNYLKKIVMPIVSRNECQTALRGTRLGKYFKLHKSYMCAGGEEGVDVCKGDGGGPLMCHSSTRDALVQVGITSWGVECGTAGIPGVYADLSYLHQWVDATLESLIRDIPSCN